jgi:hypothetical protein
MGGACGIYGGEQKSIWVGKPEETTWQTDTGVGEKQY